MKRLWVLLLFLVSSLGLLLTIGGCSSKKPIIYRVARDPSWYPLNLMNNENRVLAFSDDLLIAIAQAKGFRIELLATNSNNIEQGLRFGDYDAILSSMAPSPMRLENYQFSEPYFLLGPVLIVSNDSPVTSLADMKEKRVGVLSETHILFDPLTYPSFITSFTARGQAIESLLREDIDGLIMDMIPAYSYSQGLYAGLIKIVGTPLTQDGLRLITNRAKDDSALIADFNEGVRELKKSHAYAELLEKWGLYNLYIIENKINE